MRVPPRPRARAQIHRVIPRLLPRRDSSRFNILAGRVTLNFDNLELAFKVFKNAENRVPQPRMGVPSVARRRSRPRDESHGLRAVAVNLDRWQCTLQRQV